MLECLTCHNYLINSLKWCIFIIAFLILLEGLAQSYGFSSSHVKMWELDHKEGWAPKNWCFWTVVLEKTLESPLDCKEIKPVHPKDQFWIFIGGPDAEAKASIVWPSDSLEKALILGKIEGRRTNGWQRMRWLDGIIDSMHMNLS